MIGGLSRPRGSTRGALPCVPPPRRAQNDHFLIAESAGTTQIWTTAHGRLANAAMAMGAATQETRMSHSPWTSAVAAGLAAMWIGAATTAEAGIVVVPSSVTFVATGTVKMADDAAGLFGGGDLTGLSYVATYTVHLSPSVVSPYYCCVSRYYRSGRNGLGVGYLHQRFSDDHHRRRYCRALGNRRRHQCCSAFGRGRKDCPSRWKNIGGVTGAFGASVARTPSLWLGVPGATDFFDNNTVSGVTGGAGDSEFSSADGTFAFLNVSSISQHLDGTMGVLIPEPSTWAMMLLGFAGLGFAGYRSAKGHAALG